jgi:hypothetical protein
LPNSPENDFVVAVIKELAIRGYVERAKVKHTTGNGSEVSVCIRFLRGITRDGVKEVLATIDPMDRRRLILKRVRVDAKYRGSKENNDVNGSADNRWSTVPSASTVVPGSIEETSGIVWDPDEMQIHEIREHVLSSGLDGASCLVGDAHSP